MRNTYNVDEFLGFSHSFNNLSMSVDKKISLLYDFCILRHKNGRRDARERAVEAWLSSCKTETQIDNAIHPLLVGDVELNDVLTQKGLM